MRLTCGMRHNKYRETGLRRSPGPLLLAPPGRPHQHPEYITKLRPVKRGSEVGGLRLTIKLDVVSYHHEIHL